MSETEFKTYGLTPTKRYKLFEHEGFQVVASIFYDEGRDGDYLALTGYVDELGDESSVKLGSGTLDMAQALFDGLDDPVKVVGGWLNAVGPAVNAALGKGSLPEDMEVSKIEFENGTTLRRVADEASED